MKAISTTAPGKVILFGEHSVVYDCPAIAMAISLYSSCQIEQNELDKIQVTLQNYNQSLKFSSLNDLIINIDPKFKQIAVGLKLFNEKYDINFEKLKINISSSLIPSSGLGSSASVSVALVSAIDHFYQLNFNKDTISEVAFTMEKVFHGTPSGIDNTICTYGNLIYYKKGQFEYLTIPNDLNILVSYTNVVRNTGEAVGKVRKFHEAHPKLSRQIFKEMETIAKKARIELIKGNKEELGKLMNENQKCLNTIGVSNEVISEIVNIALDNGAYGSKLTGAGLGGCVITIGSDNVLSKILKNLNKKGYKSFLTSIDCEGVKIE